MDDQTLRASALEAAIRICGGGSNQVDRVMQEAEKCYRFLTHAKAEQANVEGAPDAPLRVDLHGFSLVKVPVQQPASMCSAMVRESTLVETLCMLGYSVTK